MTERRLQGTGASPGAAVGPVARYAPAQAPAARPAGPLAPEAVAHELTRLRAAVEGARARITAARAAAAARAGEAEAAIFDAHLLMLDDPALIGESERRIREQHLPAAAAVEATASDLAALFAQIEDAYLRDRAADLADVAQQVVRALDGAAPGAPELPPGAVVVAEELLPSDTALLGPERVAALVTARGGRTAHVAILARALGLPAVVGVPDILTAARDGELAAVDGARGEVILAPEPATLAAYRARVEQERRERERRATLRELPAVTIDGVRVKLLVNIGAPDEVKSALANGAEGVGLFRTEFLFIERAELPGEEEQVAAYRAVAEGMAGRPVVIRTLDVGGDKPVPGIALEPELNPFLGVRGLRLTLRHPALFRTQLRAVLRAATAGDIWLMFPMVTTVADVRAARAALTEAAAGLRAEGVAHREEIPVGIMIEVPAAALAAERLIREVDFFSIGTNDLVQYTLAVDRTNAELAAAYTPLEPAVLRLIELTVAAGEGAGKPVAVCGELAGDPAAIPLLLGLGIRELSMTATRIPEAKELIRGLSTHDAAEAARAALGRE